MTARDLLAQLREKGVQLKTSGGARLVVDAPKGVITPELRDALAAHKIDLLALLKDEENAGVPRAAAKIEAQSRPIDASYRPTTPYPATSAEDQFAATAVAEIKQLQDELMRVRAEEEARRAEFEASRLAGENELRAEQERWRKEEEEAARHHAEKEKQRILAEARERSEEENRRQIADNELARAEEDLKRMRAMEEARRAELEARFRSAEEEQNARIEARRRQEQEAARHRFEQEHKRLEIETRKQAQEDELRRRAEMRFTAIEEEIARAQAREEARRKASEQAQRQTNEVARRRGDEDVRRKAELEAQRRTQEEAQLRARIEAELRAEVEARRQAEDESRRRAEEEARRRAEEEARRLAEEEARRRAEEESQRRVEEETRRRAEEAARRQAAEEARRLAEEEHQRKVEEERRARAEAEERLRAETEARIRAEIKAKIQAEEDARRTEEAVRRQAEEERIRAAEARKATQYHSELQGSEVDKQAPAVIESEAGRKVNEIAEWFDVGLENHAREIPAESADPLSLPNDHLEHDSFVGVMHDDFAGEFQPVSVPETETGISSAMLRRLGSEKPPERAAALAEIARSGGEGAFRHISSAFDDQSVEVRNAAVRALSDLHDDRAALFTRALREASPARRIKIGAAIASSGLANQVISNLTGESRDKTYDAFSLLFLMSKAGEVQPLMRAIEEHTNIEVRLAVIKLLALSGQPDILPSFRRMAVRGSLPPEVRSALMEAIYQMTSHSPVDTAPVG